MSFEGEWARCAGWLDAALDHAGRTHSLKDVAAAIARGEARFWPGARSALVALVETDPGERRLLIWLAGGDRAELEAETLPLAEAWGRQAGCRRALVIGRPGWERTLKSKGYAPLARIVAKDLQDELEDRRLENQHEQHLEHDHQLDHDAERAGLGVQPDAERRWARGRAAWR